MEFCEYTIKDKAEVFESLKTCENGLSGEEALRRQKISGLNEIKTKETGLLDILMRQFKSPFFYLLFAAAVVAIFIGEKIDCLVILSFIIINVILGFLQEARAEKSISLLKRYTPLTAMVLRGKEEKSIDKKFLVLGDMVLLKMGDIIPADLRVVKTENFLVDESILTGESVPLSKTAALLPQKAKEIFEAKNIVFAGTSVVSGEALGVVIAIGKETVTGKITKLVSGIERESVYEKDILKLSKIILRTVVIAITFIFLASLAIKGTSILLETLLFSITLIVSIIPEALPVVITFAFSSGSLKLAKEKVVVKRLSAVEDLGNIEILCTDKTGTLTKNKLKLKEVYAQDKEKMLFYALLASDYIGNEVKIGLNPLDFALYEGASDNLKKKLNGFKQISEIPFDPKRLRNATIVEDENRRLILISRGAPETILELCSKFESILTPNELIEEFQKRGKEGKRVLAVAIKEYDKKEFSEADEKDMIFLGFCSFEDPIKETAGEAIDLAKKLGVIIKMITGDGKEVAGYVAKEFNLIQDTEGVISGEALNLLSAEKFDEACLSFSVFARISPETKLAIIRSLQKKYTVGFLGEGINDTPAIKAADIGMVVQEAADVPRQAADVILLEKDLRVIINGIKNGRNIFSNINKYIKCALASNFGNFYSIAVISLFINFLPMLPVQILLGNILSDFPLIAITTDSIEVEELRKPKTYQVNRLIRLIIFLAIVSTVFDFIFFGIFYGVLYRHQPAILQTLWFIESILTELALIFIIRAQHFFLKAKRPSWPLISLVILDALFIVLLPFFGFGQKFFHFTRPPISAVLIVFFLVLSYTIVSEIVKLGYFRYFWRKPGLNHE